MPVTSTLTRCVVPDCKSLMNTSLTPFVSSNETRLVARLSKAIQRPSCEICGLLERGRLKVGRGSSGLCPVPSTLTRAVDPAIISRTNMSVALFVSPITRSPAALANAIRWPFEEMDGNVESPFPPPVPCRFTLTSAAMRLESYVQYGGYGIGYLLV